uniref:Interleukin 18 n=1 Tax=Varanus komodoensis TaxID=61221 RepID=A0A8D2LM25_VARKO
MTDDKVCMIPARFENGQIFFWEGNKDLESDSWRKSGKCEKTQILRNKQNLVLIAKPDDDDKAIFESMTIEEMSSYPGIKFDIHSYQDTKPKGLPVAFTIQWHQKTYYMCVEKRGGNLNVQFKEGDVPNNIEGTTSNVIFIKTPFSEGDEQYYMFETALEQGYFLAFEKDKGRLIVKRREAVDQVDESIKLHHSPFPEHMHLDTSDQF